MNIHQLNEHKGAIFETDKINRQDLDDMKGYSILRKELIARPPKFSVFFRELMNLYIFFPLNLQPKNVKKIPHLQKSM